MKKPLENFFMKFAGQMELSILNVNSGRIAVKKLLFLLICLLM